MGGGVSSHFLPDSSRSGREGKPGATLSIKRSSYSCYVSPHTHIQSELCSVVSTGCLQEIISRNSWKRSLFFFYPPLKCVIFSIICAAITAWWFSQLPVWVFHNTLVPFVMSQIRPTGSASLIQEWKEKLQTFIDSSAGINAKMLLKTIKQTKEKVQFNVANIRLLAFTGVFKRCFPNHFI